MLLLAAFAASLLGGCKSGAASQASSAAESTPISIGVSPWPGFYPWYIAEQEGFFKKRGVNVKLVWFPVYSDSTQALYTGKIDGCCTNFTDALAPSTKNISLKATMVTDMSNGADAIISKNAINSIKDLKGKKVATEFGTVDHFMLELELSKAGLKDTDVQLTNMTINDSSAAFMAGNLDAAVVWEPFLSEALKSGKSHVIASSADNPGLIMDVMLFNEKVLKARPQDMTKIELAWFDALDWWSKNKEAGTEIVAKKAGVSVAEYEKLENGAKIYSIDENLTAFTKADSMSYLGYAGTEIAKFQKDKGFLSSVPDVDGILDSTYVKQVKSTWKAQ